jgi:hypothetical protein
MSYRYWLYVIALGGCLFTSALALAANPISADQEKYAIQSKGTPEAQQTAEPSPIIAPADNITSPKEPPPATQDYSRPCEQYASGAESDLCQQWRVAEATEKTVRLLRHQNKIIISEIVLLILTLIFSILTARTASNTSRDQLRAYIQVNLKDLGSGEGVHSYFVNFVNLGQTPAKNIAYGSESGVFDVNESPRFSPPLIIHKSDQSLFPKTDGHVGQDVHVRVTTADESLILREKKQIFIWGYIEYRDIFRRKQRTPFKFKLKGNRYAEGTPVISLDGNNPT